MNMFYLNSFEIPQIQSDPWKCLFAEQLSARIVSRISVLRQSKLQSEPQTPVFDIDEMFRSNNVPIHQMGLADVLSVLRVLAPYVECAQANIPLSPLQSATNLMLIIQTNHDRTRLPPR